MPRLHHFPGGIKLKGHKSESLVRGLQQASLPRQLFLPLKQHIGEHNKPLVDVGDRVLKGHMIASGSSLICAAIVPRRSSTTVTVTALYAQVNSHSPHAVQRAMLTLGIVPSTSMNSLVSTV